MIRNKKDAEALIAFAVQNNRPATIEALRSFGYTVNPDISDADLFTTLRNIWAKEGITKVTEILKKVDIDETKLTNEQAQNLVMKYKDVRPSPQSREGWFKDLLTNVGDFFSGTTEISQNPNIAQQTNTSCLSPTIMATLSVIGLLAIVFVYWRNVKNANVFAIVIGAVLIGILLYGAFCKNITTTQTGGGGSQTVHNGALGWLQGILSGLNISVVPGG